MRSFLLILCICLSFGHSLPFSKRTVLEINTHFLCLNIYNKDFYVIFSVFEVFAFSNPNQCFFQKSGIFQKWTQIFNQKLVPDNSHSHYFEGTVEVELKELYGKTDTYVEIAHNCQDSNEEHVSERSKRKEER